MSKKEEFKRFVSNHPKLVNVVKNKEHSWQDLFELYDLYGNDETLWDNYLNKTSTNASSGLTELTKLFKNVNLDNVRKYVDTAQKAIGVIEELTGSKTAGEILSKGPEIARPINKIFED